jgi:hypothetical protein
MRPASSDSETLETVRDQVDQVRFALRRGLQGKGSSELQFACAGSASYRAARRRRVRPGDGDGAEQPALAEPADEVA